MTDRTPRLVADTRCAVGEGPLWHPQEQCLYWIDIPTGQLFRYDPATGTHALVFHAPAAIGGFTIQADGALLLFMARGMIAIWRRDGSFTPIVPEIPDERHTRFNDVVADPHGRVFAGTMATPERPGRLYRIDPDGQRTTLLDDALIPNGMDFSPDLRHFYYTDSDRRTILRFDYDAATGALTNPQVFVTVPEGEGVPDGLAVDAEGYVWSARWDGSALYRYTPDGQVDQVIHFPARKVSSVIFGGPDYTDLYVTTAGGDNRAHEGPGAGALFHLRPGVRGRPPFFSRLGLEPSPAEHGPQRR